MVSRSIVYYITAHGYGHGVRSCDVIRALQARCPDTPLTIVSGLPEAFFRSRLEWRNLTLRAASFDVGLVQRDGIRADLPATVRVLHKLMERHDADLAVETAFLRSAGAGVVVADVPWLPLAAARSIGVPAIAASNFSWDWIYEPFAERDAGWRSIVDLLRRDYACADCLIKMPFSGVSSVFRSIEQVPLSAEPGRNRRSELANALGIPAGARWYLLAFTALDWDSGALERLGRLRDTAFLAMEPAAWAGRNIFAVSRAFCSFSDLVASVDGVVSKPGYGVVSDCIVNRKPLVYAEREDFREYHVLVEAIRRYLRHACLSQANLYRGDLGESLAEVESSPEPVETMPAGGASIAAEIVAGRLFDARR
jgi:L-arabinokinase